MGIDTLWTTCKKYQNECTEHVDLIEIAASQKKGIELLVDFNNFLFELLDKFWTNVCSHYKNQYLRVLGGEYASLNKYVTNIVRNFQSHNISLVFYIDGAKCSSEETKRHKMATWKNRHEQDIDRITQILDVYKGNLPIEKLNEHSNILPVLAEIELLAALKKCKCDIYQVPAGECDTFLIKEFKTRKAYAIWSRDTDFCIIKDAKLICFELFDDEVRFDASRKKNTKLMVKVITHARLMSFLKLKNHDMLIDLSIIVGNDYTKHIVQKNLQRELDLPQQRNATTFMKFAHWIRPQDDVLQKNPFIAKEMSKNAEFRQAVAHCHRFYRAQIEPEVPPEECEFSQVIEENVKTCQYSNEIMSMHHKWYWHRKLIEDDTDYVPCAEWVLQKLRSYIYKIVLPPHEEYVTEFGRTRNEKAIKEEQVKALAEDWIPTVQNINEDDIEKNKETFYKIMSHQEQEATPNWFAKYGTRDGFIVFVLRYFLNLNWDRNLRVTENEFLALCAMTFFEEARESIAQSVQLRPQARCITILNWYQNVYRHAYSMLGGLLYLKAEFPIPSELFSGSVWIVMLLVSRQSYDCSEGSRDAKKLEYIKEMMNDVYKSKRELIVDIVNGYFSAEMVCMINEGQFQF